MKRARSKNKKAELNTQNEEWLMEADDLEDNPYQTEEEYNNTLVKCAKRLIALDKDTGDYYKNKYGINYEKLTGGF